MINPEQARTSAGILIVEDEIDIQELIAYNLESEGFRTRVVESAEEALTLIKREIPDLLLLDIMLPGMNGIELCQLLKNDEPYRNLPIIMLTARGEEKDIITGLELGADDYITKPFSPAILVARVKAILRRQGSENTLNRTDSLTHRDIALDPLRREVRVQKEKISLTYTEFEILHLFLRHPGWVFTRGQIVDRVRGDNYPVTERSVDFQLVGLRRKLGRAGDQIKTVRGVGYRLTE